MGINFTAFLGVAIILIITPGPDMALTMRNALSGGRRAGVFTALGVGTGMAAWTIATSAGLATILLASEAINFTLKLLGASYLTYLGIQALRRALRPGPVHETTDGDAAGHRVATLASYRQGMIGNIGNPKAAVIFTSLLPQFVSADQASFTALLVLGLLMSIMTCVWFSVYSAVIAKAGDLLRLPKVRRTLDGIMGTALVALGVRLATASR